MSGGIDGDSKEGRGGDATGCTLLHCWSGVRGVKGNGGVGSRARRSTRVQNVLRTRTAATERSKDLPGGVAACGRAAAQNVLRAWATCGSRRRWL